MRFVICCDGGPGIGMGHVVRCASLAEEIRQKGNSAEFVTRVEASAAWLRHRGFDVRHVQTGWEFENDPDWVVLDSYSLDSREQSSATMRAKTLILVERPLAFQIESELIACIHLGVNPTDFQTAAHTQFLLGPSFVLLRRQFQSAKRVQIRKDARKVLICFGSTDEHRMSERAAKALSALEDVELHFVLARDASDAHVKNVKNAHIHRDVSNMAALLSGMDLALVSASTIFYETCAVGLPAILVRTAQDQTVLEKGVREKDLGIALGEYTEVSERDIRDGVANLLRDFARRKAYSEKAARTVDGHGVGRVVDAMLEYRRS